ncbi:hypothetical protein SAMN05421688_2512 [Poseidonocella pacifica]|uniref:Uncharacterized protein n=1 Tax=Poseidonocella pacifica TaxID=871651 RepID=A0A1I0XUI7_9RHOB|nr:hypothetical protein SAMN05421688_2512 [Poseidonocella pacifica]
MMHSSRSLGKTLCGGKKRDRALRRPAGRSLGRSGLFLLTTSQFVAVQRKEIDRL